MTSPALSDAMAQLLADPARLRAAIQAEEARRSGSRSLAAFVKQAWPIFETAPLQWNWHHDAICLHLEEFAAGRIRRLRIHQPPRSGKSSLFAICFPAWVWSFRPSAQFVYLSHSDPLSTEHSMKCRMVIESDWYRQTHMRGWSMAADQNSKSDFLNTAGGRRIAGSTSSGVIGRGGDFVMFDDPLSEKDTMSPAATEHVNRIVASTMNTRLNNPRTGGVALNMQRLSTNDPASIMNDAEELRLPAEYVPARATVTFHVKDGQRTELWRDPRNNDGDLLWPDRWSKAELDIIKAPPFGVNAYNAQYQQEPRSFEGGMFKRSDWRFYQYGMPIEGVIGARPAGCIGSSPVQTEEELARARAVGLPAPDIKNMAVDCAFKDNPSGSRVAIHVWQCSGPNRFLLYRDTRHMAFGATKAAILAAIQAHPDCNKILIEDAANGSAIIDELKMQFPKILAVRPEGSKGSRAAAIQPYQQAGNCFLPEGATWLDDFVSTTAAFAPPSDKNSDDVDAMSMALRHMELPQEGEVGRVNWGRR